MSTADILAMARGGKAAPAKEPLLEEPEVEEPPGQITEESITVEEAPPPAAAEKAPPATEKVDRSSMSVDDMIAWCRQHDAT